MIRNFISSDWKLEHASIRQESFFTGQSFSSADAVFIDPKRIYDYWIQDIPPEKDGWRRSYSDRDRGFGQTLSRLMEKRRSETADLLYKTGGILVCRLWPRGEALQVVNQGGLEERIDRYSWLPAVSLVDRHHQLSFPANGRFLSRTGEDVLLAETGNPFEDYLRRFEGKIVYRAVYRDLLSTPIDRFAQVLAYNKAGDVVALQIPFDEGRLVLIPPIEGVSPTAEASALLEAVSAMDFRPAFSPEPDWLPAYSLPGEDKLRDELSNLIGRRDKLAHKVEELSAQLDAAAKYKRILYTKGRFALLPVVQEAFRTLGFRVSESGYDLLLESEQGDAIGVVRASEQARIGLDSYQHLLGWVDSARTKGEGPSKGILVVSGSRELDPRRRPTQFTPEVLRGCQSQGFCLLSTYELFKLVREALTEKDKASQANSRQMLLECVGEFRSSS